MIENASKTILYEWKCKNLDFSLKYCLMTIKWKVAGCFQLYRDNMYVHRLEMQFLSAIYRSKIKININDKVTWKFWIIKC